jgi:tetratricopeptide (TPR) repeat protein
MKSLLVKLALPIALILLFSYASAQQNQTESRNAEFYINRGVTSYEKGQLDRAISDYNKALEINPRFAEAYSDRGVAYYFKREYEKSWEDVKKAQSLGCQIHPKFLDELRKASGRQN